MSPEAPWSGKFPLQPFLCNSTNEKLLYRASNNTFLWKHWASQYRRVACEHLSFELPSRLQNSQCLQQVWWDNSPIALNLEVFHGDCSWDYLCWQVPNGTARPWPEFHLPFEAKLPGNRKAHPGLKTKLTNAIATERKPQRALYQTLHWYWHACRFSWVQLFKDRLEKFGSRHSLCVGWDHISSWEAWTEEINKMKPFQCFAVVRTLTNSWITSSRVPNGAHVSGCIF